ncbi:MAG: hypothetical protein J6K12_01025 [Clostridia bacterium]|nr:hypothetical protein [Clostridia bacterium]
MKKPLLSEMTLREKIGQTVVMRPSVMAQVEDIEAFFKENPYGGMWTCGHIKMDFVNLADEIVNADDIDYDIDIKIRLFSEQVSRVLKAPFISAMDAERGAGRMFPYFSDTPSNNGIAATRDTNAPYEIAKCIAHEMKLAGSRWNWGPVCDNPSPLRAVSLTRSFSSDIELTKKMLTAYIQGVQSEDVAATLKHFPGTDKDEYRDTHFADSVITQSLEEWWNRQGCIFQAGIDAGVYAIMIDHGSFPAADDTMKDGRYVPATVSRKIVTELLKEKMGFKGVVITDAVEMRALTSMFSTREDFVAALYNAGNDVILGPTYDDYFDIVERAIKQGKMSESRIDDACQRVLDMKEKLRLFEYDAYPVTEEDRKAAVENTTAVISKYAPSSITWMSRRNNFVPVAKDSIKKAQLVYIGYSPDVLRSLDVVKEELESRGVEVQICEGIQGEAHMKEIADNNDLIMYFAHIAPHSPYGGASFFMGKATQFLHVLEYGDEKSVCVSTGSPFVYYDWFTCSKNFLNAYSYDAQTLKTVVKGIFGEVEFTGKSPYDPNPLAPRL